MGSALFRNLHFLGVPRTLALAQVGAAISTVSQWATVEMAAPTWAGVRARMGTVEMAAPTWARARARAGQHPTCVRARARSGWCCAFYRN